jgi:hypothetical protein
MELTKQELEELAELHAEVHTARPRTDRQSGDEYGTHLETNRRITIMKPNSSGDDLPYPLGGKSDK